MPPHSITTHTLTHSTPVHTTPWHTQHATQPRVCYGVCCLHVAVFVCRCLPALSSLNPNHTTSPKQPHMAPPMHEPMSEWEGAVACVWTPQPKHQPPQPSHDATHTTCSLSFHPLAIHTLHNTTTPSLTPCDRTCSTPTHLLTLQQHTGFEAHVTAPHTHEGWVHVADINCC